MTDVEMDVAASDVYDCVKSFLAYCPDGSADSAIRSAMDYVKETYATTGDDYRKLNSIARQSYNDLTKTTGATMGRNNIVKHRRGSFTKDKNGKAVVKDQNGKVVGRQG